MANDTIENQSLWQVVVALMQLFQVIPRACSCGCKAPATLKPKNTAPAKPKAPTSAMDTFLKPSRTAINRTQYNAEKLADIDGNLANRYIKADAVNDTDSRYALHTILTGVSRL
jgi:hypothetical protein